MCGRTACTLAPDDVVRACTYKDERGQQKRPVWKDAPGGQKYWQSCNIAPTSHTPVLVQSNFDGTQTESDRTVIPMKWGLTPSWHKGDPYKVPYETNNCRSEGMLEKKTFKVPMQKGFRCVVLADGYFEWKTTPQGKQPYFFYFPQPGGITYPGETVKPETGKSETVNSETVKSETVKDETVKDETVKPETVNSETVKSETVKDETVKDETVKPETGKSETVRPETVKSEKVSGWSDDRLASELNKTTSVLSNSLKQGDHSDKGKQEVPPMRVKQETVDLNVKVGKQIAKNCEQTPQDGKSNDVKDSSGGIAEARKITSGTLHPDGSQNNGMVSRGGGEDVEEWTGQRLLTMAGLYDVWTPPDGSPPLYSYSVITVPASADIDWCHHRMPAILSTENEVNDWLDSANINATQAASLIKQHKGLGFHPVSKEMNNSRYKSPDCIKPVGLGKPKVSPSSNVMMNWLKTGTPPAKKRKSDST